MDMFQLTGLQIAILPNESPVVRFAAAELSRLLYRLTGQRHEILNSVPKRGDCIVLDTDTRLAPQGYRLSTKARGTFHSMVIAGADEAGILYGVYALAEACGVGYSLGGELLPELPIQVAFPKSEELIGEPSMAVRSVMLDASGTSAWGLEHFRFFLDQAARLRLNRVLVNRDTLVPTSKPRTSELAWQLGRCFDEEFWCSPAGDDGSDALTELLQAEAIFRAATEYAAYRAIEMGIILTCPEVPDDAFQIRLSRELETNPRLGCVVLSFPDGTTDTEAGLSLAKDIAAEYDVEIVTGVEALEHSLEDPACMPELSLPLAFEAQKMWNPELTADSFTGAYAEQALGPGGEKAARLLLEQSDRVRHACLSGTADETLGQLTEALQALSLEAPIHCQERVAYLLAAAKLANSGAPADLARFSQHLATRGDWGVLAAHGTGTPSSFELVAKGKREEVWLSWTSLAEAASYRLERQSVWGDAVSVAEQAMCQFIDQPTAGSFSYQVIALDASGKELGRTESKAVTCGEEAAPPRILTCKPYGHLVTGEGYLQRVVIQSDRELGGLSLAYRMAGDEEWWAVPMNHRFRDSYQAMIPAEQLEQGVLEFFVEVLDEDDNRAVWPAAAEAGHAWSIAIIR